MSQQFQTYIGIDPDLHDLAIGYWGGGEPYLARVVHVPRRKGVVAQQAVLEMIASMSLLGSYFPADTYAIAVEAQTLQRTGLRQHKNPQDIVTLGNVAGAALAFCARHVAIDRIAFPSPERWKGQIPKHVMQARLYTDLGWGYEMVGESYARPVRIPKAFNNITAGQWKHVGDALLLARWASKNIK